MKTIIKIFICISLIYTPFFAFAGAAEKWEIVENFYDTSKNTVNVTAKKITQDAANSGVYKVQVPVSSSALGNTMKRMLWVGAASAAVTALIEGVGWIIDEGSKTILKPLPVDPSFPDPDFVYLSSDGSIFQNSDSLGRYAFSLVNFVDSVYVSTQCDSRGVCVFILKRDDVFSAYYAGVRTPRTEPLPDSEPRFTPVSDSELGDLTLGKSTEPNSPKVPQSALIADAYSPNNPVSDAPAPQATNDALDSANPQPGTEPDGSTAPKPNSDTNGDGTPDTYDSSKPDAGSKFTLPNFCTWAPSVCEFFKVQKQDNKEIKENQKTDMAQNQSFFDEVKDWFTWSKENDDLPEDEKPQISEIPTPELKEDAVRWSAQCPADAQVPINMQGVSSTITFSWSPWCQLLDMIKPAIIASAYIGAAFIVLGLRT